MVDGKFLSVVCIADSKERLRGELLGFELGYEFTKGLLFRGLLVFGAALRILI
jgi:hypothetical protein